MASFVRGRALLDVSTVLCILMCVIKLKAGKVLQKTLRIITLKKETPLNQIEYIF